MSQLSFEEKERLNRAQNLRRGHVWNWHIISRRERERASWTCEHCGLEHDPVTGKPLDGIHKAVLQVHHLDGIRRNCQPENLLVVCNTCHVKIEQWRPGWKLLREWHGPPKWMIDRGLTYR